MPSDSAEILVRLLLKTSRLAAPAPPGEQVFRQAGAKKGGITHRKGAARHENVHRAAAEGIFRHGAPHAHHAGSLRALKLCSRGIDGRKSPDRLHRERWRDIGAHQPRDRPAPGSCRRGGEEDGMNGCREPRRRYPAVSAKDRKNVGSVRFELTIDGSLRHASVLQRVIIRLSADPLFITCKDRWSPSPFRTRPRPPVLNIIGAWKYNGCAGKEPLTL